MSSFGIASWHPTRAELSNRIILAFSRRCERGGPAGVRASILRHPPGFRVSAEPARPASTRSGLLPKRNYGFEKRQKELRQQLKKEAKKQRKLDRAKEPAEARPHQPETPDA